MTKSLIVNSENNSSSFLPLPSGPLRISESHCADPTALSLVVPTLNEAQNIETLIKRVARTLKQVGISHELILVDDNSVDRTVERTLALVGAIPELKIMRRTDERGLATAVIRGWQASRGEVLGVMDADLQHPPEVLTELWKAIVSGAELAVASRWAPGGGVSDWSRRRRLVSRTAQLIGQILLPNVFVRLRDPLSGFFLVRREKVAEVTMDPRGYKILIEVLARSRVQRITEVSYIFQQRAQAKSKATWKVYRDYLLHLAMLRRACRGKI